MKPYYNHAGITIYHGDCREILPHLEPVDLVLTDPPYGVGIKYLSYEDTMENWIELTKAWLPMALEKSKKGVLFPPGGFEQELFLYSYIKPKWRICWYKGAQAQRSPIGFKHWENIFVYGNTKSQCPDYFRADPQCDNRVADHPVPKPPGFYKWLLTNFSKENDTILEPFLGSGTGLLAAKQLGRKAIGIEIELKYVEIAIRRLQQEMLPFGG